MNRTSSSEHPLPQPVRFGIGPRITLFAVLLVALSALMVGTAVYTGISRLLVREEVHNLGDTAQLAADRLLSHLQVLRQDTLLLANMPPVRGLIRARNAEGVDPLTGNTVAQWHQRLASIFVETLRNKPDYYQARLVDRNGDEVVKVVRREGGFVVLDAGLGNLSQQRFFERGLELPIGEVYLSRINLNRESGRITEPPVPVMRGVTPVMDESGQEFGVVVLNLAFETMVDDVVRVAEQIPNASFFITNAEGDFLYHPDRALTFGFERGRRHLIQTSYPELAIAFLPGAAQQRAIIRKAGDGPREVLQLTKVSFEPENRERFIGLALVAPYAQVLGQSIEVGHRSIILALFLTVAAGLAAAVFARAVTRPVRLLTDAAQRVAAGDYAVRLPVDSRHEVGVLARAFRNMIDQIQERGDALEAKADELVRLNRELEQFVYVVSHDLKAPLRAVSNLSSWLEDDLGPKLEGENRQHLELLRARVARMDQFIEALLAFSRAGRIAAEPERVDTTAMLREVVQMLDAPPGMQVEIPADMPVFDTDRVHFSQVFANLINNAIKHHHRTEGQIRVGWHNPPGRFYEFWVSDDGPGIAPEYHERIFQVFQTLRARDESGNTGIGLSIVKKVIETLGGGISLQSAPGQGSTFRFTWPKRLPPAPVVAPPSF